MHTYSHAYIQTENIHTYIHTCIHTQTNIQQLTRIQKHTIIDTHTDKYAVADRQTRTEIEAQES